MSVKTSNISSAFYYTEPNFKQVGDNQYYDLQPINLEDLSVYIELHVESIIDKTNKYKNPRTNEHFIFKAKMPRNGGESKVSLQRGNTQLSFKDIMSNNGISEFLTTEAYDKYTIKAMKSYDTHELFGIKSIDIEYKSYAVPVVTIHFTDIKGAALYGVEELGRNAKGENKSGVQNLVGQFFQCFFTIPYPRFHLYVKGYYGQPVHYDLMCSTFNTTFDSSTGNYEATARMVGYSYALISDVTMSSLLAAPFCSKYGKDYWKEQVSGGTFSVDGSPFPTLLEIYEKWQSKMTYLDEINESDEGKQEVTNLQHELNNYTEARKLIYQILDILKTREGDDVYQVIVDKQGAAFCMVIQNGSGGTSSFTLSKGQSEEITDKIERCEQLISDINWNQYKRKSDEIFHAFCVIEDEADKEKFKNLLPNNTNIVNSIFNYYYSILDLKKLTAISSNVRNVLINKMENIKDVSEIEHLLYYYIFDYRKVIQELNNKIKEYEKELTNRKSYQEKKVNEELEQMFGFKFTIKNISQILFAHLETLLYIFDNVNQEVKRTRSAQLGTIQYTFPEVLQIVNQGGDGNKCLEEMWIGDILNEDEPEAQMVDGILSGLKNEVAKNEIVVGQQEVKPWKKTCIQDLFLTQNPFFNQGQLTRDFVQQRSAFVLGLNIHNQEFDPSYAGEVDAENYFIVNPHGYSTLLEDLTSEKFIDLVNGNYNHLDLNAYTYNDTKALCNKITVKQIIDGTDTVNFQIIHDINQLNDEKIYIGNTEKNIDVYLGWESDFFTQSFENYLSKSEVKFIKKGDKDGKLYPIAKEMKESEYIIKYIPRLKATDMLRAAEVHKDEDDYYFFTCDGLDRLDIYQKALCFLLLFFHFDGDPHYSIGNFKEKINNFFTNNSHTQTAIEAVPYFWVLLIGGVYYWQHHQVILYDYPYRGCLSYDFEMNIFKYFKKDILGLFEKEYKTWVDTHYQVWDKEFAQIDNSKVILKGKLPSEYYFNENNHYVQEMSKQFFKIVYVVKSSPYCVQSWVKKDVMMSDALKVWGELCDKQTYNKEDGLIIQKEWVLSYLKSFTQRLKKLFENVIHNEANINIFLNGYINKDMKIATYNYLKQIWDRWLIYDNEFMENWKMNFLFEGNTSRIHFIDAFYNNIGNVVPINLSKFITLIKNVIGHQNYSFLSFLSYFYQDNNCVLFNIQNFLNIQNQHVIDSIFKPIPTLKIEKSKMYSDLVVLYHFRHASDIEDGFDISDKEELLPVAIRYKNQKTNGKIPAFGVTYGMQNQNYFTDISISTTKPAATEQSIQATVQIGAANSKGSDNNAHLITLGQDMYTVYAQQSYECSVTMMGCALIQPLMYFQLLNVPLFRGAYIIQKVTHTIAPNHMTTKFVGTRLSKISSKIVEEAYYYMQKELTIRKDGMQNEDYAAITNDCPYAFFSPQGIVDENGENGELTIDTLIAAIEKTCEKTLACKIKKIDKEKINDSDYLLTAQGGNMKENAKLFDIILQAYAHEYLQKLSWVVISENNGSANPSSIYVQLGSNEGFKVNVCYLNNKKPIVIGTHNGLNTDFYISLMKYYGIKQQDVKNDSFKNECSNFTSLCNGENWKEKVTNFFFKENASTSATTIIECDDVMEDDKQSQIVINNHETPIGYSFEGDNTRGSLSCMGQAIDIVKRNEQASQSLARFARANAEDNNKLIKTYTDYIKSHVKNNSKDPNYQCAKYVRIALEQIGIDTKTRPNSACRYYEHLIYWGFTEIFYGLLSAYKGEYLNGDIVVTAGLTKGKVHGHIQIYCDGKWYSDRVYNNACVYTPERVSYLFRLPTV